MNIINTKIRDVSLFIQDKKLLERESSKKNQISIKEKLLCTKKEPDLEEIHGILNISKIKRKQLEKLTDEYKTKAQSKHRVVSKELQEKLGI